MTDAELIDELGGPAKLAERLKYGPGGIQRVHNWRTRGIPPRVRLEHPDVFRAKRRATDLGSPSMGRRATGAPDNDAKEG